MKKFAIIFCITALCLCGCSAPAKKEPEPAASAATAEELPAVTAAAVEELIVPEPEPVSIVLRPEAPGLLEVRSDTAVIDYSNSADGYVMACFTADTDKRLKVLVQGPQTRYSYNISPGEWSVFPLSEGNGGYKVSVYENLYESRYAMVLSAEFQLELSDEFAPFIRPNQFVAYDKAENTVQKGAELCLGVEEPLKKVEIVYDYVIANFSYDYDKAANVKSGYLPMLDMVLEEKKGICFDYAALMTAMLRSQGIPCKLVVGYAGSTYHAWINVWTEENGWIDGIIFFDGHMWKRMDPTFASTGEQSEEIMDFIENGSYTEKYLY